MKRFLVVPLALLAVAASAYGQTAPKPPAEAPVMKKTAPGQATSVRTLTAKAKVVAVDVEKREITLERKDGKTEKFAVGPNVKRLNEIAPGDYINVKYHQGLLLKALGQGEQGPKPEVAGATERAGADQAPGGAAAIQVSGTVTVTAVDPKTRSVVLETPKGELVKVVADPSIDLDKVKAGLKLEGVYTEAVAVTVEKVKPKK